MAKSNLVIVESPAKAKTIGKYLGPGYEVKASMGHVRDLPKSKLGVDVEHGFEPVSYTHLPSGSVSGGAVSGVRHTASMPWGVSTVDTARSSASGTSTTRTPAGSSAGGAVPSATASSSGGGPQRREMCIRDRSSPPSSPCIRWRCPR